MVDTEMTATPTQQPDALRLADVLEKMPGYDWNKTYCEAAFQLRHIQHQNECLHAENQSLTTENKRLREAILRLRHWSMGGCYHGGVVFDLQQWIDNGMAGELPEYPAHLHLSQQQKTALKPVSKPLCRDCADFGPICPTTGLPCDGSGEKP